MSIAGRAAKGTAWVAGGTYINQLISFGANIALMRLLAPEHFGILALAVAILTFGQKLVSFGFNHALIHRPDEIERAIRAHQFLHLATSLALVGGYFLVRPFLESSTDPLTLAVLLVLACSSVITASGHTPRILMEKELAFSGVMKVNVATTALSNGVAIVWAWFRPGIEALVIRQVLADVVAAGGYYLVFRKPIYLIPDRKMLGWFMKFGAYLWVAGIATWVTLKFDDYLVGTMVSAEQLGFYARAYALATLPTMMIANVIAKVAFPVYSKLQADREKLSAAFSQAMGWIFTLTLPAAVGLALFAPELVEILFGPKWAPMVPLVRWLLIYASFRPLFDNTGELFTAIGKPKVSGLILLAQACVVAVLCPVLTGMFNAPGAAFAVGLAMVLGVVLAYRTLARYVTFSVKAKALAPAVAVGVAVVATLLVGFFAESFGTVTRLALKGTLFVGVFGGVLFAIDGRKRIDELKLFFGLLNKR